MFLAFLIHSEKILFIVILLLRLDTQLSKSVFVTKFVCTNLTLKTSTAKVINSGVVIYLS